MRSFGQCVSLSKYGVKLQLGTDNWSEWSILVKQLLVLEGCWSVVDPAAPESSTGEGRTRSDTTKSEKAEEQDADKNVKALALIIVHLEPFHLKTAGAATSAKALWKQFESTFQAKSVARQFQLRQQLMALRMENDSVTKYIERAKSLYSDLVVVGHDIKETEICWAVLLGLPKQFEVMRTILMSKTEELSLNAIYPQLLQVEQQSMDEVQDELRLNSSPFNAAMGRMHISKDKDKKCFYCNKLGHMQINCHMRLAEERRTGQRTVAF